MFRSRKISQLSINERAGTWRYRDLKHDYSTNYRKTGEIKREYVGTRKDKCKLHTHTEAKSAGQKLEEYAHPTKPEEGLG